MEEKGNRRPIVLLLLLGVLTLVVFLPIVGNQFVDWDDSVLIFQNPGLLHPGWASLANFWLHPYKELYIPLWYSVCMGLVEISRMLHTTTDGMDPRIFHGFSLLLHLVSVAMVFLILRILVKRDLPAALGAAMFAVHPIQVEIVAWASGMNGLLAGFFSIAAILLYLLHLRRHSWVLYGAATVIYALALLAKPSAIMVPVMLAIVEWMLLKRRVRQFALPLVAWLGMAVVGALFTHDAQPADSIGTSPLWTLPVVAYDALTFYLYKLLVPLWMCTDYGRTPTIVTRTTSMFFTWLVPFGVAVICWRERFRCPWLAAGMAIFAAGLLPVLGFTPFLFQMFSTVADRYAYLPMLGIVIIAASAMAKTRRRIVAVIALGMILILGILSHLHTRTWHDNRTLFEYTRTANPKSELARAAFHKMKMGVIPPERPIR